MMRFLLTVIFISVFQKFVYGFPQLLQNGGRIGELDRKLYPEPYFKAPSPNIGSPPDNRPKFNKGPNYHNPSQSGEFIDIDRLLPQNFNNRPNYPNQNSDPPRQNNHFLKQNHNRPNQHTLNDFSGDSISIGAQNQQHDYPSNQHEGIHQHKDVHNNQQPYHQSSQHGYTQNNQFDHNPFLRDHNKNTQDSNSKKPSNQNHNNGNIDQHGTGSSNTQLESSNTSTTTSSPLGANVDVAMTTQEVEISLFNLIKVKNNCQVDYDGNCREEY